MFKTIAILATLALGAVAQLQTGTVVAPRHAESSSSPKPLLCCYPQIFSMLRSVTKPRPLNPSKKEEGKRSQRLVLFCSFLSHLWADFLERGGVRKRLRWASQWCPCGPVLVEKSSFLSLARSSATINRVNGITVPLHLNFNSSDWTMSAQFALFSRADTACQVLRGTEFCPPGPVAVAELPKCLVDTEYIEICMHLEIIMGDSMHGSEYTTTKESLPPLIRGLERSTLPLIRAVMTRFRGARASAFVVDGVASSFDKVGSALSRLQTLELEETCVKFITIEVRQSSANSDVWNAFTQFDHAASRNWEILVLHRQTEPTQENVEASPVNQLERLLLKP
ncbi:hypothetical protein C8R45DRAFT_927058 [Mycena sanguinolenta]|nr:hypothetical protein C8R45DRAFT_927058 [Mycena sanguinolenta]